MPRLEFNKLSQLGLGLLSIGLVAVVATALYRGAEVRTVRLAAGSKTGDSYILCTALKKVVERHHLRILVNLVETEGTVENLAMLERAEADFATVQADVAAGPSAQTVAVLFDDTFQLLVRERSSIHSFADLRGRHIAVARGGGQFDSFLRVADHFNLGEADFAFVGATDAAADAAFAGGQADALFRVRALGNPTIQRIVNAGKVRFLSIDQAPAMKIRYPAFEPAMIPAGAYRGEPAVPPQGVSTVSVHRLLVARESADREAVRAVAAVLLEQREEIMQEIPTQSAAVRLLVAQVRRPDMRSEFVPALHRGAASYYDKDKPTFLQANADFLGLVLSLILMVGSWIWQLKGWMTRQQKNAGDKYSSSVVDLLTAVQRCDSVAALDEYRVALLALLTAAVHDLDADTVSEESFQSFRAVLQIVLEVTRERRELLTG